MKRCILSVFVILISITLITGIQRGLAQIINTDFFDPNIINIIPSDLMLEATRSLSGLRAGSAGMRFKTGSQTEMWTLSITTKGQGLQASNADIGINSNAGTWEAPPLPPNYSSIITILGKHGVDLRLPGSEREEWGLEVRVGGVGSVADASKPGFFPGLYWDPNLIGPAKLMELRLGDANGPVLVDDMKTINEYLTTEEDAVTTGYYLPMANMAMMKYTVIFEPSEPSIYYRDGDNDGYGDPNDMKVAEEEPPGYVLQSGDCDDADDTIFLGATEICDSKDNDCDRKIDIEITDPNNIDLAIEELKEGLNKILIKTFCVSYSSHDFLLNFKELLNIASLNLDRRDVTGYFLSTYFFFGRISGNGFELSKDSLRPNILYIY